MHTSPSHLSLFLPVGCQRTETEEKEGKKERDREKRDRAYAPSGGRREKGLFAGDLSFPRVRVTCCSL